MYSALVARTTSLRSMSFLISPDVTRASMNPSSSQKPKGTMAMNPKSPELLARAAMKAQTIHQPIASGARAKRRLIMDERIQLRTQGEMDASWLLAVNHQIMSEYLL